MYAGSGGIRNNGDSDSMVCEDEGPTLCLSVQPSHACDCRRCWLSHVGRKPLLGQVIYFIFTLFLLFAYGTKIWLGCIKYATIL